MAWTYCSRCNSAIEAPCNMEAHDLFEAAKTRGGCPECGTASDRLFNAALDELRDRYILRAAERIENLELAVFGEIMR